MAPETQMRSELCGTKRSWPACAGFNESRASCHDKLSLGIIAGLMAAMEIDEAVEDEREILMRAGRMNLADYSDSIYPQFIEDLWEEGELRAIVREYEEWRYGWAGEEELQEEDQEHVEGE